MPQFSTGGEAELESVLEAPVFPKYLDDLPFFHQAAADIRMPHPGSESSRSTTPTTDGSCCHSPLSTSSWAVPTQCGLHRDPEEDEGNDWNQTRYTKEATLDYTNLPFRPMPENNVSKAATASLHSQPISIDPSDAGLYDELESQLSEDNSECDDDDEEHNGWSGDDGTLEATVIAAVGGDLSLAAYLVPRIHKDVNAAIREKVKSWQQSTARGSSSASCKISAASEYGAGASTSSKRRRQSNSKGKNPKGDGSRRDDDEEEEEGEGDGQDESPEDESTSNIPLACPFYKLNPEKYGVHCKPSYVSEHYYRPCTGPGFSSIQRLKEHFKRKHTFAQCDRCYRIMPEALDVALVRLREHRNSEVRCEKGDPTLKEGIDEEQWVKLEKRSGKRKKPHRVTKWFQMWDIIFPDVPRPSTPWYNHVNITTTTVTSPDSEAFSDLFITILDHKIQQGDISFQMQAPEELEQLKGRLKNTVQQTFKTSFSIQGSTVQTDASSSMVESINYSMGGSTEPPRSHSNSRHQTLSPASQPQRQAYSYQPTGSAATSFAIPGQMPQFPMAGSQVNQQSSAYGSTVGPMQQSSMATSPVPVTFPNFQTMSAEDMNNLLATATNQGYIPQVWQPNVSYATTPGDFAGSTSPSTPDTTHLFDSFQQGQQGPGGDLGNHGFGM